MFLLLLLKIKSVITSLVRFAIEHWKVLAIVAMALAIFHFKTAYEREKHAYEAYKANVQLQADMQKAKNEILRKQAETTVTEIVANHTQQLAIEKLDRKLVEDKLKGSINEISNDLNIYRDSIKLRNESTSSIDVSKVAEHTNGTANSNGNCNQTLAVVVDACKITDYDYEALYNLYKRQCDIYGCE